jgi:pimeloyl-ACP methyl ester carboxylesterase
MRTGPKPRVVLLHSSAASARQWDALGARLAGAFDVHAIDLHGHGARADWAAAQPMTLADEAALAQPLLEGADAVHLVGHSYGGAVALELASLWPEHVRSVSVYEPVLFRLLFDRQGDAPAAREVAAVAQDVDACVARGLLAAAAQRFVDFWSGAGAWSRLGERAQASIAARMGSVAQHFHALFADAALAARLPALRMPLQVLSGERTPEATRRIGALLRTLWPDARHETLPGMGHMGPMTHGEAVNGRVVAFLQDTFSACEPRSALALV